MARTSSTIVSSKRSIDSKRCRRLLPLIVGILLAGWGGGCAHQYVYGPLIGAEKAPSGNFIPIYLPKTIIDFDLKITVTQFTTGKYASIYKTKIDREAIAENAEKIGIARDAIIISDVYVLKQIGITGFGTHGERDESKLFLADIPSGGLTTSEFNTVLNPDGLVSGISSSVTDHTSDTLLNLVSTVAKGVPLDKNLTGNPTQALVADLDKAIEKWTNLRDLKLKLLNESKVVNDGASLKWLFDQATTEQDSIASEFTGTTEDKVVEFHCSVEISEKSPNIDTIIDLSQLKSSPQKTNDQLRKFSIKAGDLVDIFDGGKIQLKSSIASNAKAILNPPDATSSGNKHGLPYVVPSLVKIDLSHDKANTLLLSETVPMAQFGATRFLPASLNSISAVFKAKYYEATGALSEVTTSTTAIASDSIVTPIAAIQDKIKAKADAKAAADAEAAAKDDELAKLTREANILEQKAKIKEYKSKSQ